MAQFRTNINNTLSSTIGGLGTVGNGTLTSVNGGGMYDRIITSLNGIKLEILATTENIKSFLSSRFAVDGQITNNLVSRFRTSFPLMSGIVVGMFLEEIKNGSSITREQLILFNNIPIAPLVGRRLKVIDRCGNVASVSLIPSPCGGNFFINIESCETVSANGFIFLEVYPQRLTGSALATSERYGSESITSIDRLRSVEQIDGRRIGVDRVYNNVSSNSDRFYSNNSFITDEQAFVNNTTGRRCNCG